MDSKVSLKTTIKSSHGLHGQHGGVLSNGEPQGLA